MVKYMTAEDKIAFFKNAYLLGTTEFFREEYFKCIPSLEKEKITLMLYKLQNFKYDEGSCSLKSNEGDNCIEIGTNPIQGDIKGRSSIIITITHNSINFQYDTRLEERFMSNNPCLSKKDFQESINSLYYLLNEIGNHLENEMYEFFEII